MRAMSGILSAAAVLFLCGAGLAQDNVEGPWGAVNGDLFSRARSAQIPSIFSFGSTGIHEAWRVSTTANGSNRTAGFSSLVFDSVGNVYWRSQNPARLSSVSPGGSFRWNGNSGGGPVDLGGFTDSSPVVGAAAVYVLGGGASGFDFVAAFNKSTGARLWQTPLTGANWTDRSQLSPLLYNGKLYIVGRTDGLNSNVYQVNAANGALDWTSPVPVAFGFAGSAALVPNVFGAGQHGLYFNTTSGNGADFFGEAYGVRITSSGAALQWESDGGHVARSHVIYSPVTNHIYTATWNDYGGSLYIFDPVTGGLVASTNIGYGHGFYDVAALDWDDRTVIAGGFDGRVATYRDNGDGTITTTEYPFTTWWGEYRVFGQLLQDCATGHRILNTGTNSRTDLDPSFTARAVVLDLDDALAGPFDDGPMYIDNLEIYDGTALPYGTNFNAYANGTLAGQDGWVHDNAGPSGDDTANPVVVVNDPTGSGRGKVAAFNAAGTGGGWQGVFHDIETTTSATATVKWKQYRADLTDNVWLAFGDSPNDFNDVTGWGIMWDLSRKIHPWHFDDDGAAVLQTAGVWQDVTIVYDFASGTATVTVDGTTGAPVSHAAFFWEGIILQMEGTALSNFANPPLREFNTGIANNHAFTTRSGVLAGPDGKLYYHHANTAELVALEPACTGADTNCDGSLNQFDIQAFIDVLSGGPGCSSCAGDANADGSVNQFDIQTFIDTLAGVCP